MPDLFAQPPAYQPLADRMRPQSLQQMVGQSHLLSSGKTLRQAIESGRLHSLSAVLSGVKDIRISVDRARQFSGVTILFVDEVHLF